MFDNPLKLFRILAVGFMLIGLGLIGGAVFSYRSTAAFLRTAVATTGEVIGYERRTNSEGEITYFPVIVFTPANGDEIEFTSSTGSSARGYAIGASVPLRYDPALPFSAAIDTPADLWLAAIVLSILGVAFTSVGGGMLWLFRAGGPLQPARPMLA